MYHRHYGVGVKLAGLPNAATDYRVMIADSVIPDRPSIRVY